MEARIKSPRRSLTSSDHSLLLITCLNPIIRTQNKAENQWRTAKRLVSKFMNSSGCPPPAWLLCLQYVCVLINHMSSPAMDGLPPLHALTGQTPDISFLLQFSFWEPVHYRVNPNEPSSNFPSISNERKGYWVTKKIEELDQDSANRGEHIKFLLKLNNRKLLTRSSPIINFLIILKRTNHS